MFRTRRHLRRWAAGMLFAWLFGVAAGVANACLVPSGMQPGGQRFEPAVAFEATDGKAAAMGSEHHHGALQMHHEGALDHEGLHGKSNCQDFCDKSTVSIPPLKSALDDVHAHALQPAAVAIALPIPAFSPVQLSAPRRDGGLAPPIPIAFVRLTL